MRRFAVLVPMFFVASCAMAAPQHKAPPAPPAKAVAPAPQFAPITIDQPKAAQIEQWLDGQPRGVANVIDRFMAMLEQQARAEAGKTAAPPAN